MDKQTLMLAAKMLEIAAEKFSNHGCNDLSTSTLNLISDEKKLCDQIREWNGDPDEDWPTEKHHIGDSELMGFLSDELKTFAEAQ